MSQRYEYETPRRGAPEWDVPINGNFRRIAAHLELLNWRLMDLDGIDFHETASGEHDYYLPRRGATEWHLPLNDNFEQIAADVRALDERVGEKDGATPGTYEYETPRRGATEWHLPLNDNFEQIAADVADLDQRIADLESETGSYVATIDSGRWNDPSVWDTGSVPTDGDNVLIRAGTSITLSGSTAQLDWVRLEGGLTFDPTVDTHLAADTVLTTHGSSLDVGTPSRPIRQGVEARMTFLDTGPIDEDLDPMRKGRGLLVQGDVSIHGAEKTPWTTLASAPRAGDSSIDLSTEPTNWNPGDRIVLPGVEPYTSTALDHEDEERTIASISGTTVTLDAALEYDHVPPKPDLDSYVLNLSRNVVLASENTDELRRGHSMIMTTGSEVRYVRFEELGRTNKDRYLTNPVRGEENLPDGMDPNPAARYPLHWHRTGSDAEDPHVVEGVAVDGSPGWGIVNHHAYAHVTDSVTYDVRGSGFVAEGGNERGSFKRNFALRSEGSGETIDSRSAGAHGGDPFIDDFGHAGHGIWLQSPLVETVDNVVAGHRHHGIVLWLRPLLDKTEVTLAECSEVNDSRFTFCPNVPMEWLDGQEPMLEAIERGRFSTDEKDALMRETRKVPSTFARVKRVEGNEVFGCGGGLDLSRHNFKWKHERFSDFSVIEDLTVYNIGTFVDEDGEEHSPDLPRHLASGHQGRGGNVGVSFRYTSNVTLKDSRIIGSGRENSIGIPFHDYRWTTTIENCTVENWDWGVATGEHRLEWIRGCTFRDNNYDVNWGFDNVGPAILDDDDVNRVRYAFEFNNQKASDVLTFGRSRGVRIDGRSAYVEESAPDFVPFPDESSLDGLNNIEDIATVDDETNLVGLTNAEMFDQYGVCIGGAPLPDDAVEEPYLAGALLDPAVRNDPPESVWLDAADADPGGAFEVVDEADAANDAALRCTGSDSPTSQPASISFECAPGTYEIHARVWPDSWNGDDVYFRVDGGEWLTAEKLKSPVGFEWHDAAPVDGPLHEVELSEGTHTLEVACGSDGALVDEVLLTSDETVLGAYGESTR